MVRWFEVVRLTPGVGAVQQTIDQAGVTDSPCRRPTRSVVPLLLRGPAMGELAQRGGTGGVEQYWNRCYKQ